MHFLARPRPAFAPFLFRIVLGGALASLGGCGAAHDFFQAKSTVPGPTSPSWYGPFLTGMSAVDPRLQQFSGNRDYLDFRMAQTDHSAALITTSIRPGEARTMGRIYTPFTQGGAGWAPLGSRFGLIDAGLSSIGDIALGFSDAGNLLAAFWDGTTAAASQSAAYGSQWGDFRASVGGGIVPYNSSGVDPENGKTKSLVWTSSWADHAFLAYHTFDSGSLQDNFYVLGYVAGAGWNAGPGEQLDSWTELPGGVPDSSLLLNDGLGLTAIWSGTSGGLRTLRTARRVLQPNPPASMDATFSAPVTLNSAPNGSYVPDPRAFAAATDGLGNVVAMFLQTKAGITPCPHFSGTEKCEVRMFGTARDAAGNWNGPSQLDGDNVDESHTTYYQPASVNDSSESGGIPFATPQIVYMGSGRFIAAYSYLNTSVNSARTSQIYVRGYTVGLGWDAQPAGLEPLCSASDTACQLAHPERILSGLGQYRMANDLKLITDGQGNAMLLAQYVIPSLANATTPGRRYGMKIFRYNINTGWNKDDFRILDQVPGCSVAHLNFGNPVPIPNTLCQRVRMEGAIFSSGEAVIAFPAPVNSSPFPFNMALYTLEYHL